jgi:hypothetical protein
VTPTLTPWAPKQVTPSLCDHPHRRITHQTGLVLAPVDVHLTAMMIYPRGPTHRLRSVLWLHGVDAP